MLAPGLGRTRSEGSDRRADLTMVLQVIEAVERALNASKSERDGLGRRVSDVLSRAAMLIGSGTDEYVEREIADTSRPRNMKPKSRTGEGGWTTSIVLSANSKG
jgi:hypothetical protein